jgi:hypothetical protein
LATADIYLISIDHTEILMAQRQDIYYYIDDTTIHPGQQ